MYDRFLDTPINFLAILYDHSVRESNNFSDFVLDIPDSSTLENTTGDVMSPPPLPDDPVRGAMGILSPTSPTTDTEHTTGDCTNMTNNFLSYFSNNKLHTYFLILQPLVLRLSYGNALKIFHWYLASVNAELLF